jgi:hypothetical protein
LTVGVLYEYDPVGYEVRGSGSTVLFNDAQPGSAQIVVPKNMDPATFNLVRNVLFPYLPVSGVRIYRIAWCTTHVPEFRYAARLGVSVE